LDVLRNDDGVADSFLMDLGSVQFDRSTSGVSEIKRLICHIGYRNCKIPARVGTSFLPRGCRFQRPGGWVG